MNSGIEHPDVLAISRLENMVLLTADKDSGDLVFRQGQRHCGILLIRLAGLAPHEKAEAVSTVVKTHGPEFYNAFSVLNVDSLRVRRDA